MAITFATTQASYSELLKRAQIKSSWQGAYDRAAAYIMRNRTRYEDVARGLDMPWQLIGCLHWREADGSFAGVLHNGEKILGTGRKTRLEPKGRGPFDTWEEAAIDAIRIKVATRPPEWSLEGVAWFAENFNGLGYRRYHPGVNSPYLWSGTTVYGGGKYTSDGHFDYKHVDQQLGVMPLYQMLIDKSTPAAIVQKAPTLRRLTQGIQWMGGAVGSLFTLDSLGTLQSVHQGLSGIITPTRVTALLGVGVGAWIVIKVLEAYTGDQDVGHSKLPS